MSKLTVLILAGHANTPLNSPRPKPLTPLGGSTVLFQLLSKAKELNARTTVVITGEKGPAISEYLDRAQLQLGLRIEQFHTSFEQGKCGALFAARSCVKSDEQVLILDCDQPMASLLSLRLILSRLKDCREDTVMLCSMANHADSPVRLTDASRYCAFLRENSRGGQSFAITGVAPLSEALGATQVFSGAIVLTGTCFLNWEPLHQRVASYELIGLLEYAVQQAGGLFVGSPFEMLYVANPSSLAFADKCIQAARVAQVQKLGVYMVNSATVTFLDDGENLVPFTLTCGQSSSIGPGCVLVGDCAIGDDVAVAPGQVLVNAAVY